MRYKIVLYEGNAGGEQYLSLAQLAEKGGLHPAVIEHFINYGLLEPLPHKKPGVWFSAETLFKLRMIERLRNEMGISLPGIGIILELREKIRSLQQELDWLRGRV